MDLTKLELNKRIIYSMIDTICIKTISLKDV